MPPSSSSPKVSIGLPVYNGDNYLKDALDTILGQTYSEFELIICDNASTDRTEAICREYAERDDRIRYFRNPENIGAGPNFNLVVTHAKGGYFKWIAHDDMHEPDFLRKCVEVLDGDPSVALVYSRAVTIDHEGQQVREWGYEPGFWSSSLMERWKASLAPCHDPIPLPIFGLIRTDILRRTHLQGGYPACDLVLLGEIALMGRFHEIPEPLFVQRNHDMRAGIVINDDLDDAADFWDPKHAPNLSMHYWIILRGFAKAAATMPVKPGERLRCFAGLSTWIRGNRKALTDDVKSVIPRIPLIGPPIERLCHGYRVRKWRREARMTGRDIATLVPEGTPYVLADHATFLHEAFAKHAIPLINKDGEYFGSPKNDAQAIDALEQLRGQGVRFVVIARPAFWWFDHYLKFTELLRSQYRRVISNRRVEVYEDEGRVEAPERIAAGSG